MEDNVDIKITDAARLRLKKAFSESAYKNPALRVVFSGFG
jgi:hypothetical protein